MTTTLTLDDDVLEAAETHARVCGKKLDEVVSDLIRTGLRNSLTITMENGRPVFTPPPGSPIIPSSRAREIMDNELP